MGDGQAFPLVLVKVNESRNHLHHRPEGTTSVPRGAATGLAGLPADELVAALHPYGELSAEHTAGAARQVAELIRYLNAVTYDRPEEAIPDPNTAAAVLGALHATVTRLPQLLLQLRGCMRGFADDPDLATGSTDTAADRLAHQSAQAIARAEAELWRITETLKAAYQAADRLYLDRDDEPGPDSRPTDED